MLGLGLLWQAALGGGGFAPALFVDSVNGSDSNNGLTLSTALRTIAAAQTALASSGTSIGFAAGSYWREQFNIPRNNFTVVVVGTGNPPVFDGADLAGTWTRHADTVNFPDVWQQTWVRSSAAPSATEVLGLWADGVRPTYQTSLANLQANGGWNAISRTAASTTVYIKSVADPNSSGVVYEITKRDFGINGNAPNATYTGTLTGPIEAKRCLGHYNAVMGPGSLTTVASSVKQALVRDGTVHHIVLSADVIEDIIAIEGYPSFTTQWIPITAYRSEGVGFTPTLKRCFVKGIGLAENAIGIYSHASTNGGNTDSSTYEQCYVESIQGMQAGTLDFASNGCYMNGAPVSINQPNVNVKHLLSRHIIAAAGHSGVVDAGPVDASAKTRLIENCVFYVAPGANGNASRVNLATRNGSIVIRNCIFFFDSPASWLGFSLNAANAGQLSVQYEYCIFISDVFSAGALTFTNSPAITADHNIFINANAARWNYNGTAYANLAAWRAFSGQDLNSVVLSGANMATIKSTYFNGDPANGDFRLKPGLGTFGDGVSLNLAGPQEYWDWNARGVASGAPQKWPVPPANLSEYRSYIANPASWNFYP